MAVLLKTTAAQQEAYEAAAKAAGKSRHRWCLDVLDKAASSNGKTAASKPANEGSTPSAAALPTGVMRASELPVLPTCPFDRCQMFGRSQGIATRCRKCGTKLTLPDGTLP